MKILQRLVGPLIPGILGREKATPLTPALPPTFPDQGSPDLFLADVGGSPAQVLDDFRHLYPVTQS